MEAPGTGGGEVWMCVVGGMRGAVSSRVADSTAQRLHLNVNKGVLTVRIIMPPVC